MSVIDVVVGAAFGSEGKGHITAQLVHKRLLAGHDVVNIRVAGPNAGHTVIDASGNSFALRAVPVGAAISDRVYTYIAPGSEVDLPVLVAEIELLRSKGHKVSRMYVSGEATLLTDEDKATEADAQLTGRIGSTGKGIGAARASRIMRESERVMDNRAAVATLEALNVTIVDDSPSSVGYADRWCTFPQAAIIIEGTQGYGLGLHAGYYPQVTSSDCRAIDFLAMAGVSPWHAGVKHLAVWLVARVFPIRVAGNSGPLKGETSWDELGLPEEHTTVTHKVRRVGEWDADLIKAAVAANGGGQRNASTSVVIALTMIDQMFPDLHGVNNQAGFVRLADPAVVSNVQSFLTMVEDDAEAQIGVISTSDRTVVWRD